jgi:membrane protease YdiL (CAAX protease family)
MRKLVMSTRFGQVLFVHMFLTVLSIWLVKKLELEYDGHWQSNLAHIAGQMTSTAILFIAVHMTATERYELALPRIEFISVKFAVLTSLALLVVTRGLLDLQTDILNATSTELLDSAGADYELAGWPDMIALLLSICLVAPYAEELVFRGILLNPFLTSAKFSKHAIASAIFFGIVHGKRMFLVAFVVGLSLAYLYRKFQSLWPCMVCHGSLNLLTFVLAHA